MSEHLQFASRYEFREWLTANGSMSDGVWLLFGKPGGPKTLKAAEALEEALCFGWIDGQIQSLNAGSYIKYFSRRREKSNWSDKNKGIAERLEKQGIMTDHGRAKITEVKENGQWDKSKTPAITDDHIEILLNILKEYDQAYQNYQSMSPSVKKTYARAYFDAKTDAGREKRIAWMIDRLNKNLKPM